MDEMRILQGEMAEGSFTLKRQVRGIGAYADVSLSLRVKTALYELRPNRAIPSNRCILIQQNREFGLRLINC